MVRDMLKRDEVVAKSKWGNIFWKNILEELVGKKERSSLVFGSTKRG